MKGQTMLKKLPLVLIVLMMLSILAACEGGKERSPEKPVQKETESIENDEAVALVPNVDKQQMLKIEVNDTLLYAEFEDNSSAEALKEKLRKESLELDMHDYGGFEKVAALPWDLPENNETITTQAGDVILYQGNELTIYYDTNTWNLTRVARIQGTDSNILKDLLGEGDVKITLSLE